MLPNYTELKTELDAAKHTIDELDAELHGTLQTLEAMEPKTARAKVLAEAGDLIDGDRDVDYGHPYDNLGRIARLWSVVLRITITRRQVAWCLLLLKVARDVHTPKRDNLVDAAGYAALAAEVGEA